MTSVLADDLPNRLHALALAAYGVGGVALGTLYFGSLSWSARLFAAGGRMRTTVLLMVMRFLLLAGVLTLASRQGAMPLLTMMLGLLGARAVVVRSLRCGGETGPAAPSAQGCTNAGPGGIANIGSGAASLWPSTQRTP